MSASLAIDGTYSIGDTPYGNRKVFTTRESSFNGSRIRGSFLDGGIDFELTLSSGAKELEHVNILRSDDNAIIYMRTCGFAQAGANETRFIADFEAPNSSNHSWLNSGKYAGIRTVNEMTGSIELAIYDISNLTPTEPSVTLIDPAGEPNQPWDCATTSGQRGATVFTENVSLGGSLSVGSSKRGSRNIIPITGGTVSGRFDGVVVPGGADYQLIGATTTLDARYLLEDNSGEVVLVRNCGPFGALVPQFEARSSGQHAYLNENRYLSSDPGIGGGGVSITFYEAQ